MDSMAETAWEEAVMSKAIRAAFVYGSVAKGTDRANSDIDLMVISDSLRYADQFRACRRPRWQSHERSIQRYSPKPIGALSADAPALSLPVLPPNPASSSWARKMTSAELENLLKIGQLKREPPVPAETSLSSRRFLTR